MVSWTSLARLILQPQIRWNLLWKIIWTRSNLFGLFVCQYYPYFKLKFLNLKCHLFFLGLQNRYFRLVIGHFSRKFLLKIYLTIRDHSLLSDHPSQILNFYELKFYFRHQVAHPDLFPILLEYHLFLQQFWLFTNRSLFWNYLVNCSVYLPPRTSYFGHSFVFIKSKLLFWMQLPSPFPIPKTQSTFLCPCVRTQSRMTDLSLKTAFHFTLHELRIDSRKPSSTLIAKFVPRPKCASWSLWSRAFPQVPRL